MPPTHIIAPFNQVNTMSGRNNAAATAGACHNFTLSWIALMLDNSDPSAAAAADRMRQLDSNRGGANAVLQKTFNQKWDMGEWENADSLMFHIHSLKGAGNAIDYGTYNQTVLENRVTNSTEPALLYSFWFPGGTVGAPDGAHTIGFFRRLQSRRGTTQRTDNIISAFDPNYGECAIVEGDFPAWVNSLVGSYASTFNDDWLRYVRPK